MVTQGFDVQGVDEVNRMLRGMAQRARAWTVTAPRIHDFLLSRQRIMFATAGASEGAPWAGYGGEPKYRAYKQAVLGDLTILGQNWKATSGAQAVIPEPSTAMLLLLGVAFLSAVSGRRRR